MKIFWLDFESTGIDPDKDKPLELAVSVADFNDPFNARPVYHAVMPLAPWIPSDLRPIVLEMHTKNGLLADCSSWLAKQVRDVEEDLLRVVPLVGDPDERPVMGGSSIRFDYKFMKVHMPRVATRFEFRENDVRCYDVSVLKLYCRSMGMPQLKKAQAHRAQDDVLESIAHGKECTEWLRQNLKRSTT